MPPTVSPINSSQSPLPAVGWQAPLVDMFIAVVRSRWIVIGVLIVCLMGGVFKFMNTPKTYRASAVAVLLPKEKPVFDVSVDTGTLEASEDGAKRSLTGTMMLPANPDLYTTILRSRSVLQSLTNKHGETLTDDGIDSVRSDELIAKLRSMIKLEASEEGILTVTVTSVKPALAALIANDVVAEGERASKQIERGLIEEQARYIENAWQAAAATLEQQIQNLKAFTATHGFVDPRNQAADRVRQIRDLSTRRDELQRELASRLVSFTEQDATVKGLQVEIELCQKQTATLQTSIDGGERLGGNDALGILMVDYETLVEKVRRHRDLVVSLAARAEVFRIRAEQPAGNLAMVRPAVADTRPAGPSRKMFLVLSVGLGLFGGVGLALVREQWRGAQADPYVSQQIRSLRSMLAIRSTTRFAPQSDHSTGEAVKSTGDLL